jgi:hypothetical protein
MGMSTSPRTNMPGRIRKTITPTYGCVALLLRTSKTQKAMSVMAELVVKTAPAKVRRLLPR